MMVFPPITDDQRQGVEFLADNRVAMLADVPGLGKTAQLVRACDRINAKAVTVIVPNRTLALNVAREFEKWSGLGHDVHILQSGKDDIPATGVVVTTYALVTRPEVAKRLAKRKVCVLACDEAHALKEVSSARTKAILQKKGLLGNAARVWLMTGTPAPNHAGELYVFAKISGLWTGTYAQWCDKFCLQREGAFGIQIVGSKNHAELKELLAPAYLRRDVVEGRPLLTIDSVAVDPPRGVTDPFADLPAELLASVEEAMTSGNWRLEEQPAVATVRRLVGLAKADGVVEMAAADLDGGYSKLLIFCQHSAVIDRITSELGKRFEVAAFDGRVSQSKRAHIIDAFQKPGGLRVIVGQTQAIGEGFTLTAASRVYLAEPAWTPKDNEQCIARAWRRGQQNPVLASFVGLRNSLDGRITDVLRRKSEDIALIV